jgi:hypothetical protein
MAMYKSTQTKLKKSTQKSAISVIVNQAKNCNCGWKYQHKFSETFYTLFHFGTEWNLTTFGVRLAQGLLISWRGSGVSEI